jgi:TolB protein
MKNMAIVLTCIFSSVSLYGEPNKPVIEPNEPNKPALFELNSDIGQMKQKSIFKYDAAKQTYAITAAGSDIWGPADNFHFAWKKLSGNFVLTADIELVGEGKNPYRKAGLMARQSLDPNSAYADGAIHGNGELALQYRLEKSADTSSLEKQGEKPKGPITIKLQREGNDFIMSAAPKGELLQIINRFTVKLNDPVYIGLFACSHEVDLQETAIFSNVTIETTKK